MMNQTQSKNKKSDGFDSFIDMRTPTMMFVFANVYLLPGQSAAAPGAGDGVAI